MSKTWRRCAAVLAAAVAIVLLSAVAAQAATLSGTISYQSGGDPLVPVPGATVYVHDLRGGFVTRTPVGLLGGYSLLLADGVYDVEIVAGGSYEPVERLGVDVTRDRQLDVTLVAAGKALLSGTITEVDGAPVAGVTVAAWDANRQTRVVSGSDGRWALAVQQGSVDLDLSIEGPGRSWGFGSDDIEVDRDRTLDLRLPPTTTFTVRVLGAADVPLADTRVSPGSVMRAATFADGVSGTLRSGVGYIWTDASGSAVATVFDDSSVGGGRPFTTVGPPAGSNYEYLWVPMVPVRGPTEVVVRLRLLGHLTLNVRDADEQPVASWMRFGADGGWTPGDGEGGFTAAGALGETTTVSAASYEPYVDPVGTAWIFETDPFELPLELSATLRLPEHAPTTVWIEDPHGLPVPGATVTAPDSQQRIGSAPVAGTLTMQARGGETDRHGGVQVDGFAGATPDAGRAWKVVPPAGSGYAERTFTVSGSRLTVVVGPPRAEVRGTLTEGGVAVADAEVSLGGVAARTAADGTFSLSVDPGTHALDVHRDDWRLTGDVVVTGDRSLNLRLPQRVELVVRTLGAGARPLAGASVTVPYAWIDGTFGELTSGRLASDFQSGTSDANGEVRFAPFAGTGTLRPGWVTPPEGSAYEWGSFELPDLTRPATVEVQLTSPDVDAPVIACDAPPSGWQTANVAIACTASDAGSGLADARADASFTLSTDVSDGSENPSALTGTRQVCDLAGNCATAGPLGPVAVDRAAPEITLTVAPDPLVRGDWWTVSRVAVQVTATDADVATLVCSADGVTRTFAQTRTATAISGTFYVTLEGRHMAGCTALDRLGHSGSATRPVLIDLKNPAAPSASADRPVDEPVYGWYRDAVTVAFAGNGDPLLADGSAGSGVDPASVPASQTFDRSGTFTAAGTVSDVAGRTSSAGRLTVKVDADAPSSTLTCPATPVVLGANASARWSDADAQSGLASGTSAAGTVPLDTSGVGAQAVFHTALDKVGHRALSACRYTVVYAYVLRGGLDAPPALNAVAPGVTTQVVWFSIGGDHGLSIGVRESLTVQPIACVGGEPSGRAFTGQLSTALQYDAATSRYKLSWDVAHDLPSGCAALRFTLSDGVAREVLFAR